MTDPILTADLEPHIAAFLELECEIAKSYYGFVFDTRSDAQNWQATLFKSGDCEFGPPWARLMLIDGKPVGLYAAIPGADLRRIRLVSGMRWLRSQRTVDAATRERVRLAARVSMQPGADDFYLSRIGIVESMRGHGLGRWLLGRVMAAAGRAGLQRCVLEVDPENVAAVGLYRRSGFASLGQHAVTDPVSGRRYVSQWMGRAVAAPSDGGP